MREATKSTSQQKLDREATFRKLEQDLLNRIEDQELKIAGLQEKEGLLKLESYESLNTIAKLESSSKGLQLELQKAQNDVKSHLSQLYDKSVHIDQLELIVEQKDSELKELRLRAEMEVALIDKQLSDKELVLQECWKRIEHLENVFVNANIESETAKQCIESTDFSLRACLAAVSVLSAKTDNISNEMLSALTDWNLSKDRLEMTKESELICAEKLGADITRLMGLTGDLQNQIKLKNAQLSFNQNEIKLLECKINETTEGYRRQLTDSLQKCKELEAVQATCKSSEAERLKQLENICQELELTLISRETDYKNSLISLSTKLNSYESECANLLLQKSQLSDTIKDLKSIETENINAYKQLSHDTSALKLKLKEVESSAKMKEDYINLKNLEYSDQIESMNLIILEKEDLCHDFEKKAAEMECKYIEAANDMARLKEIVKERGLEVKRASAQAQLITEEKKKEISMINIEMSRILGEKQETILLLERKVQEQWTLLQRKREESFSSHSFTQTEHIKIIATHSNMTENDSKSCSIFTETEIVEQSKLYIEQKNSLKGYLEFEILLKKYLNTASLPKFSECKDTLELLKEWKMALESNRVPVKLFPNMVRSPALYQFSWEIGLQSLFCGLASVSDEGEYLISKQEFHYLHFSLLLSILTVLCLSFPLSIYIFLEKSPSGEWNLLSQFYGIIVGLYTLNRPRKANI